MPSLTGVIALSAIASLVACESARQRPVGEGAHPSGWATSGSTAFHGDVFRADGYPLAECRACHGGDYLGGDVGVSCSDGAGCHQDGVEDCAGTCHGDEASPLPASGRHPVHAGVACADCHPVPRGLDGGAHINLAADLAFAGAAVFGGRTPVWDASARRCSDVYCHLAEAPSWDEATTRGCEACHSRSPTHDRFARLVNEATCADCHEGSPSEGHIDGVLTVGDLACNACHGDAPSGAPPIGLDGATEASAQSVGAHRRHLDPLLAGRIGKVAPCTRCHAVPAEVLAGGHLDSVAPADVDVVQGTYDAASGRCVASCHFGRDPGPRWTDDSGAERACDACHGFPPTTTRLGTRHPPVAAELPACLECHTFVVETHVNGEVDFQ